ncbi:hypothetical protein [Rhodopila globiformis]|jgi:hypothetical protein|uniref:hypothetical protein n=1 Tax=Rhodopila globiformis TaxID=1071 RepID=UPI0011B024B4|nr:hypothetical protein [Rhodopila globiformis]
MPHSRQLLNGVMSGGRLFRRNVMRGASPSWGSGGLAVVRTGLAVVLAAPADFQHGGSEESTKRHEEK